VVAQTPPITAADFDDFDRFVHLPENADRSFELIAGEIIEKMVSNPRSSKIGVRIGGRLSVFIDEHNLGVVTGADGGYMVGHERYIPDAAFISKARQPVLPSEAYNPLPPDLAVEVLSPSDDPDETRLKVFNYLAAGTVVWVINPDKERVEVYAAGQPAIILGMNDTLDGGAVLPGFMPAVSAIFAD
jgi:Uma2 family endonuclease